MDAYRGELDAARERLAATQAELAETRAERDRLAEAVRSRDDALAALRHKFDGAPSAERGRRLQRAAVGATVAAVVVAAFAFVTVRAADRRAAMAEMRASSRAAGAVAAPASGERAPARARPEGASITEPTRGERPPELTLADPVAAERWAQDARRHAMAGRFEESADAWRRALTAEALPAYHVELARVLLEIGKRGDAIVELEEAIAKATIDDEDDDWLWKAHFHLGQLTERSDPRRALTAYRAFLRVASPTNAFRGDAEAGVRRLE
ncbi:MAG: hypothetical protein RIF41_35010 [Polyangiaceae bacterium]